MSAPTHPTDQPSGQLITDEKALERLFRANYTKFIADAKNRLGTEAAPAAPRVVSKAFHLAWQDRKRFHSQGELDAFIGAQIHHGATREVSRRAGLHRMDHHEGLGGAKTKHETHEMTVDEAWERLQHTLQGGAPEAYRARASSARHEAAEHVKNLGKERNWTPALALGAVVVALSLVGIWWVNKAGADRAVTNALSAQDVRNYETSYSQQVNVTLDDGTVARLGPESKLVVPNRFGIGLRAVRIEGSAVFDVKQAASQPFEVRAGDVAVLAQGTSFVVRRYRDETNAIIHVREDSVIVKHGETIRNVAKGNSLLVTNTGEMSIPSTEQVAEAAGWADGTVTISGQTLRYILPQLKRWYGLDVKVPDNTLLDRKVFLSAAANSPKEALTSVEKSAGVKFTYVGENMVFQDTVPTRATKATKTKGR
jgi:ferric-dicitrate binding protein FerR (iron transport regulator)